MTGSSKRTDDATTVALGVLAVAGSIAATAVATYALTKRAADNQIRAEKREAYERELMIRKKTLEARKLTQEPNGTLVDSVTIDKVYLWEIEDLKKRFPSSRILNVMQNLPMPTDNPHYFPSLRSGDSGEDLHRVAAAPPAGPVADNQTTNYNRLITNHECIMGIIVRKPNMPTHTHAYVRAGPRRVLHFDPKTVNAAIVTCGGLCPGLNNVIREITNTLCQIYGIGGKVYGIQGGYRGFYEHDKLPLIQLTPELVRNIHHEGGTVLGSSRGGFDIDKIVKFLKDYDISQLYVIGGDGTHRGAFRIHEECMKLDMNVAVSGIPKTIDNDVDYIDHSFGFSSAVEAAQIAIRSAKTEATCNLPNGIGIVKLMGRSSGFIAAHASMSSSDVDLCLVPEVPLVLEGEKSCLAHLHRRVKEQGYAVVVVAEGAGEDVLGVSAETDAGGNRKLPAIGEFMKKQIEDYFVKQNDAATVKYIDPSYTIRSVPANAADSLYCMQLAQNAVHGAMAGFTGFSVGLCNNRMVFLPIPDLVATSPRHMNPRGRTWERVLSLTRQPNTVPAVPKDGEKKPSPMQPSLR